MKEKKISIAILAGGESKRFGEDKLRLEFKGKTFLDIIIEKISSLSDDYFVVGRILPSMKSCKDLFDVKASLVGIYTALKCSKYDYTLVLAGDLPLLSPELLNYLISNISKNIDIIVPIVRGYYEPLVAIYSKRVEDEIRNMIISEDLKVSNLYDKFNTLKINEDKLRIYDKELYSFFNVNKREEYIFLKENFE